MPSCHICVHKPPFFGLDNTLKKNRTCPVQFETSVTMVWDKTRPNHDITTICNYPTYVEWAKMAFKYWYFLTFWLFWGEPVAFVLFQISWFSVSGFTIRRSFSLKNSWSHWKTKNRIENQVWNKSEISIKTSKAHNFWNIDIWKKKFQRHNLIINRNNISEKEKNLRLHFHRPPDSLRHWLLKVIID